VTSDAVARARIASDLDATFVVEAAAGTGKTTALVGRVLAVLRAGRGELARIAAVTFTEKAAGEMKLRLRSEIDRARAEEPLDDAERARLDLALEQLEIAQIGTIHSFCADLLRQRPLEARVDPSFEVIDEDRSIELLSRAVDSWFERTLEAPPPGLRRFLARQPWARDSGPREALLSAVARIVDRRDHRAPWRRDPFPRADEIDALVAEIASMASLAELALEPNDYLARVLRDLDRFTNRLATREMAAERDYDHLEAELEILFRRLDWKRKGRSKLYADGILRADVLARRAELHARLESFFRAADADLAAALFSELGPVVDIYEGLKRQRGLLDFLDLLVVARDLIRDDAAVRRQLQRRFSHLFVDEFQDTDPLQAEILLLLAADDPGCDRAFETRPVPGKLFVVGDPKQSIYRFRRADVGLYHRARAHLLEAGAESLDLSTSFRAVPAIQSAVNRSFAPLMDSSAGHHARYVPLERFRPEPAERPGVIALPIPRPYNPSGWITQKAIETSMPDAIAAYIDWLLRESGWKIADPETDAPTPLRSHHICLLFRRLATFGRDLTRDYVRSLEARGIPHVLVGGRSFHEREEIMALRAVLNAVEWPGDELHVYASLRGPFVSIDDGALFHFRSEVGRLDPLRPITDEHRAAYPDVSSGLELLGELHRRRNRRPIAQTIDHFLAATRAHAGVAIWPTGEQSLANVLRLLEQARSFEARGATSFRSFVDWFEDRAERGADTQAPVVEEGSEGVRLMTVHKAKGLEFPVVILCDPTCTRKRTRPTRYIDSDRDLWAFPIAGYVPADVLAHEAEVLAGDEAEEIRISYVAATRARDLLVVPACGDEPRQGWLDVLDPAIQPAEAARRDADHGRGCPIFGPDSVVERPIDAGRSADDAVKPGWHDLDGGHVVWWDPNALRLNAPPIGGVRQQDLLAADEEGSADSEGLEAFAAWQSRRADRLASGAVASPTSISATALSHQVDLPEIADVTAEVIAEATAENRAPRPNGLRFGTLVHAALADLPFDSPPEAIEALVSLHARLLAATDAEASAAVRAIRAALAHPLLCAAADAERRGQCYRELPLQQARADGTVIDGVADLVFHTGDHWLVVDYKTDPDYDQPAYRFQVRTYAEMITAARGEPARGRLFGL
jgi:ATP-dependent exoDNAse (exonuclease V) beta subunit